MDIIFEIHKKLRPTILYVTHDEREALELADRLAILNEGEILQVGSPREMLAKPESREVAEILGGWNVKRVKARVTSSDISILIGARTISLERVQHLPVSEELIDVAIGVPISEVELFPSDETVKDDGFLVLGGMIERAIPWYGKYTVNVLCGHDSWRVEAKSLATWIQPNADAVIRFRKDAVSVWPYT
jgi:ABC-type Fe3+/spermidine/putrescine transport system ATPase subunit